MLISCFPSLYFDLPHPLLFRHCTPLFDSCGSYYTIIFAVYWIATVCQVLYRISSPIVPPYQHYFLYFTDEKTWGLEEYWLVEVPPGGEWLSWDMNPGLSDFRPTLVLRMHCFLPILWGWGRQCGEVVVVVGECLQYWDWPLRTSLYILPSSIWKSLRDPWVTGQLRVGHFAYGGVSGHTSEQSEFPLSPLKQSHYSTCQQHSLALIIGVGIEGFLSPYWGILSFQM